MSSKTVFGTRNLDSVLLVMKLGMVASFLIFSFIPLYNFFTVVISPISIGITDVTTRIVITSIILILLGFGAIIGILSSDIRFRGVVMILFSAGVLVSSNDPYILSLGVVITWFFFKVWFIIYQAKQLQEEYESYLQDSIERIKLDELVNNQFISSAILSLIVISLTWPILLLAQNFFVEIGTDFGTLGFSVTLAIIFLLYLAQKLSKVEIKE